MISFSRVALDFKMKKILVTYKNSIYLDEPIPWSANLSSENLNLVMSETSNRSMFNLHAFYGMLFVVHPVDSLPSTANPHFFQHSQYSFIAIYPQQIVLSEDVAKLTPQERNCFFEDERTLELFNFYSKQNCEHECQSFAFAQRCGCVPFYLISEYKKLVKISNDYEVLDFRKLFFKSVHS